MESVKIIVPCKFEEDPNNKYNINLILDFSKEIDLIVEEGSE
jgi:hypothetical protein